MKVNIAGAGLIPRIGLIAPVYGKDLSKDVIYNIINSTSFRVYVAATGVCITKKNIDEIFGVAVKKAATPVKTTVKKTTKHMEVTPVTPSIAEVTALPNVDETPTTITPDQIPEITEDNVDEVKVDETVVEAASPEDTPVEEVPAERSTYTSNKKKRRH